MKHGMHQVLHFVLQIAFFNLNAFLEHYMVHGRYLQGYSKIRRDRFIRTHSYDTWLFRKIPRIIRELHAFMRTLCISIWQRRQYQIPASDCRRAANNKSRDRLAIEH